MRCWAQGHTASKGRSRTQVFSVKLPFQTTYAEELVLRKGVESKNFNLMERLWPLGYFVALAPKLTGEAYRSAQGDRANH